MTPFLSICIPTYNRERFLPDLLTSIVKQYDEQVEIVIVDNGSQDATPLVVRSWQERYPRIFYERLEQNVGPDRSFLRTIEKARGSYCWLMGDDDILEEGALKTVLKALEQDVTGITVNRAAYDVHLQKRWMEPSFGRDHDILFQTQKECMGTLFVLFGFLSAQIVKRSSWLLVAAGKEVPTYFNAYALIYIIGKMIEKEPKWLYLHTPCVGWRSGNDSFALELGRHRRFALDVNSYVQIARGLFAKEKKLYKKAIAGVVSLHVIGHIRDLKFCKKHLFFKSLFLCIGKLYDIPIFWLKAFPLLLMPRRVFIFLRPLYRFFICKKQKA